MAFTLPKLEYSYDALEPFIDAKTMEIHHTKHHQAYIDKLNAALEKHPELAKKKIEDLLIEIDSIPSEIKTALINHGGGHANHSLFWQLLTNNKKMNKFEGKITKKIEKEFTSFEEFKTKFSEIAMNRFGSGWAWLILNSDNELQILSTPNQDSPLMDENTPLLGLDLWEHAYYLKYQNKRKDYIEAFWNIVNWEKVNDIYLKLNG